MTRRASLTTKQNKAKCLNYRNGKRCNRLGRFLVSGKDRCGFFQYPACAECKNALVKAGANVKSCSKKGYAVTVSTFGFVQRDYTPIEQICAHCEQSPPTSAADAYCSPCGQNLADAEHEYAARLRSENSW